MPPLRHRRRLLTALAALAFVPALPGSLSAAPAQLTPVSISADPFGPGVTGSHATEVEPSAIAAGSTIVSTFQVGRTFGGGAAAIGFATSVDGGRGWRSGLLPGVTQNSPLPGAATVASDPVVAYDASRRQWLIASLYLQPGERGLLVSRSTDGLTWAPPVKAVVREPGSVDKEWIACDGTPSSPFYGRCYLAYAFFPGDQTTMVVQTSTDGGATWGEPVLFPVDHQGMRTVLSPQPVVRPNGELVVAFYEADRFNAVRSLDGGASFGPREQIAAVSMRRYSLRPEGFRAPNIPTVAVDRAGTVYVAWYDCRFRPGCLANDLVLARSARAGVWTAPQRVPLAGVSSRTDFVVPALAVSGRALALAYYALTSTDCTGSTCRITAGLATSGDGGRTWKVEQVGEPMAMDWLPPTALGRMLADYLGVVVVTGRAVGIYALARPLRAGAFDVGISAAATAVPPLQPRISAVTLSGRPAQPRAGRSFRLLVPAIRLVAPAQSVKPEMVRCSARLGSIALKGTGLGACTWAIPKGSAGRAFGVTVAVTYRGASFTGGKRFVVRS